LTIIWQQAVGSSTKGAFGYWRTSEGKRICGTEKWNNFTGLSVWVENEGKDENDRLKYEM